MKKFLLRLRKVVLALVIVGIIIALAGYLFMLQPSFGKSPSGERLAQIEKCARYRDGIFHNRINTPMGPEGVSMLETSWTFLRSRDDDNEPKGVIPTVKRNLKVAPADGSPRITWFGHSTTLIQVNGKNILTDPHFSERASPVDVAGPKAFTGTLVYTVDDLPEIDAVLISHDHYDHLDYATILHLRDKAKIFFVPLGVGSHLAYWGIPPGKIQEVDWWQETELADGLKIVATPSRHFSGRGLSFNKTSWGSYVIVMNQYHVFFSGDSGYDTHFTQIGEKYGPMDIAIIETGQYDRLWPYIHMMPEQSVQAAADVKAKKYLPIHWSKFALALHAWRDPVQRAWARSAELHVAIVTPLIGEMIKTDSSYAGKTWWRNLP